LRFALPSPLIDDMDLHTLLYIVWDVNPDIFVIPGLNHPVRWYGVSWAVGFLISQQLMYFIYRREGRKADEIDTLTIYMVIAGMVGARLGHVLFYDPIEYMRDPLSILKVWEGGLASHGGTLGVLIALYFFARNTGVGYLWIVDRLTIAGALTGGLIRMGNLMNSEMVGLPASVPWAFIFTSVDNVPRHPAQLYEALYCFALCITLFIIWFRFRHRFNSGFMTGIFLVVLFTLRFVDEFFKINQVDFENDMVLNMGQLLSIPFVIAGLVILLRSLRKSPIGTAE
jgi:phosphatidylglycerol---prolipoprotein diacylglyceryl transferase